MITRALAFLFLISMAVVSLRAHADTASVSYDAPTEREDNTPLAPSEIAGFNVYDSTGAVIKKLDGSARSFDLTAGSAEQSLYLTTLDTDGRESAFSAAVVIPAGKADPKSPTNYRVSITP